MDEDLERMSREQLIDEVKALRQGIRQHRDSSYMNSAGTTQRSGGFCRRRLIRFLWFQTGRSLFRAA